MIGTPNRGVLYVAYGHAAQRHVAAVALPALRRQAPHLPAAVLTDEPLRDVPPGVHRIDVPRTHALARDVKLRAYELTPFDHTLYLDADTECLTDPTPLLDVLADWPIALAYSRRQGNDLLGNVDAPERDVTIDRLGYRPLALQCGVLAFRRDPGVARLFDAWQEEWRRYRGQDQAAFLRALWREPLPVWIVGAEWNGGTAIAHHFGKARGKGKGMNR